MGLVFFCLGLGKEGSPTLGASGPLWRVDH